MNVRKIFYFCLVLSIAAIFCDILVLAIGGWTRPTSIPPSNLPTYSLHGSGAPMLTNGQVLSGTVRLIVRPILKNVGHQISVWIEGESIRDYRVFKFQAYTNAVAVFEIDMTKFTSGTHKVVLDGEIDNTRSPSRVLRNDFNETKPIPEKIWVVVISNAVVKPASKN